MVRSLCWSCVRSCRIYTSTGEPLRRNTTTGIMHFQHAGSIFMPPSRTSNTTRPQRWVSLPTWISRSLLFLFASKQNTNLRPLDTSSNRCTDQCINRLTPSTMSSKCKTYMNETSCPPTVPFSKFGQTDDLGPPTRIAIWLLTGISAVFLCLRLYCKFIRHRRLHLDDWVLIASWVLLHLPLSPPTQD